jgi:hypothetical protein
MIEVLLERPADSPLKLTGDGLRLNKDSLALVQLDNTGIRSEIALATFNGFAYRRAKTALVKDIEEHQSRIRILPVGSAELVLTSFVSPSRAIVQTPKVSLETTTAGIELWSVSGVRELVATYRDGTQKWAGGNGGEWVQLGLSAVFLPQPLEDVQIVPGLRLRLSPLAERKTLA